VIGQAVELTEAQLTLFRIRPTAPLT